jgi:hypothetical protein
MNLLNTAKTTWQGIMKKKRFYHGLLRGLWWLGSEGFVYETAYDPNSHIHDSKAVLILFEYVWRLTVLPMFW